MKNTEKTMDKIRCPVQEPGLRVPRQRDLRRPCQYLGLRPSWRRAEEKHQERLAGRKFVQENPYNVGLDAAILMNPQVWVASGHVGGFSDPLMDCKECKERFRADKVIEDWCQENKFDLGHSVDAMSQTQMKEFIDEHQIVCPSCGKFNWTDIRQFNLMFKTFQGVTEDAKNTVYLRPETAQGIFVNFQNVQSHHPAQAALRRVPGGQVLPQTRSPRATSPSAPVSSSRWSWSSSASPAPSWSGSPTWKQFCHQWLLDLNIRFMHTMTFTVRRQRHQP